MSFFSRSLSPVFSFCLWTHESLLVVESSWNPQLLAGWELLPENRNRSRNPAEMVTAQKDEERKGAAFNSHKVDLTIYSRRIEIHFNWSTYNISWTTIVLSIFHPVTLATQASGKLRSSGPLGGERPWLHNDLQMSHVPCFCGLDFQR